MGALKDLLGSAYKEGMTEAEIDAALSAGKYVNLKDGRYVDKDKYDRLETENNTLKANNKSAEDLQKELDTLKAEKTDRDLNDKLLGLGFKKDALKYVKGDITDKTLVIGDKDEDNKKNVAEYLKAHPQFGETTNPQSKGKPFVIGSKAHIDDKQGGLGGNGGNGGDNNKEVNQSINDAIRAAAKGGTTTI